MGPLQSPQRQPGSRTDARGDLIFSRHAPGGGFLLATLDPRRWLLVRSAIVSPTSPRAVIPIIPAGYSVLRRCPTRHPWTPVRRLKMAYKLKTALGKAIYGARTCTVEPVIGIIKEVLAFRQFSLRGELAAAGEWCLVCLPFNLKPFHTVFWAQPESDGMLPARWAPPHRRCSACDLVPFSRPSSCRQ